MPGVPKIRAWSNTVRRSQLRLSDIDLYVLRDRPEILAALGRTRAPDDSPPRQRAASFLRGLAMIAPALSIVAYGGTVPGNNTLEAPPMEADFAVVYTALCFLVTLPGPIIALRRWRIAHRRRDWLELSYLGGTVLLGALIYSSMVTAWRLPPIAVPTWPVLLAIGLSAVVLAVMVFGSRGPRTPADSHFPRVGPTDAARVRSLVDRLSPKVREQLHAMRSRALEKLRDRDLIDDDQLSRVAATPLGAPIED